MCIGWPADLTWYKLLTDWGSFIGGSFALIAGAALYCIGQKQAKLTKIVAHAARDAAKALPRIERAYVFAEVIPRAISSLGEMPIDVCFHNHGRAPHLITQLRAYSIILESTPSALIEFPGTENAVPQGIVIKADGDHWLHTPITINSDGWTKIKTMETTLFCVGKIEYEDVLGRHRETGFCWRGYGFMISPNTNLNHYV